MDLLSVYCATFILAAFSFGPACATERPVIGILTQELSEYLSRFYDPKIYSSYIAASYIKYFESSGARIAPIPIGRSLEYYRNLVNHLNGVVFPGGGTSIFISKGYGPSGILLLTALEELTAVGKAIPALGICLGMELMASHDYSKNNPPRLFDWGPLVECPARALNLTLDFEKDAHNSVLFSKARSHDFEILQTRPITAHEHRWCVTRSSLNQTGLNNAWRVLATSSTPSGVEFVSVMESPERSFYAVIFHPEKNAFEWKQTKTYAHDTDAIATMRVFGDSFVALCRNNNNAFPSDQERKKLIHRHKAEESGANGIAYEQIYLFRQNDLD